MTHHSLLFWGSGGKREGEELQKTLYIPAIAAIVLPRFALGFWWQVERVAEALRKQK
ncbi:hypothetical protein ACOMHN_062637 [Nucella lapillus]